MNAAQRLQRERDLADLRNHKERITWLSADSPAWACGTRVDTFTKNVLLKQSLEFVSRMAAYGLE